MFSRISWRYHAVVAICLTLMTSPCVKGEHVLLHPAFGGSHVMYFGELAKALQSRGFNVTILTSSRLVIPSSITERGIQWRAFTANIDSASFNVVSEKMVSEMYVGSASSKFMSFVSFLKKILDEEDQLFADQETLAFLSQAKIDFIITDMFGPQFVLPYLLDVPYASLGITCPVWAMKDPFMSSYVPNLLTSFTDKMTFTERMVNLLVHSISLLAIILSDMQGLTKMHAPHLPYKTQGDLFSNTDLCFRLKDAVVETPRPLNPNMVNIGHIMGRPGHPLPDDLENIVASAENGVILVCFGTTYSDIPDHIVAIFVTAFSQLKQTVLWKLSKEIPDLPNNVHLFPWIPQNDLLAHDNVIAFVTHFGMNSVLEAVHHGVPMIGFPLGTDQHHNGMFVLEHKYGKLLHIQSFTSEELLLAIEDVIKGDFQKQIAKASELMKDQAPAGDTVAFWIRHVIKHGSKHLRPHAQDMIWYEYLMLDVLIFIVATLFGFLFIFKLVCGKLFCLRKFKRD